MSVRDSSYRTRSRHAQLSHPLDGILEEKHEERRCCFPSTQTQGSPCRPRAMHTIRSNRCSYFISDDLLLSYANTCNLHLDKDEKKQTLRLANLGVLDSLKLTRNQDVPKGTKSS